jgi:hypothetical protein
MLHRNVAQKIFANARGTSTHPWSCDPSAIYLYETTPRGITKSWCKMLGKWKGDPPARFSECPKTAPPVPARVVRLSVDVCMDHCPPKYLEVNTSDAGTCSAKYVTSCRPGKSWNS